MKELIKTLSAEQSANKKNRKSGRWEMERDKWGFAILPPIALEAQKAAERVEEYKIRITALLNFYHEIRDSEYRHRIPLDYYKRRLYNTALEELRGKYGQKDTETNTQT
jgi:hypothetical protein